MKTIICALALGLSACTMATPQEMENFRRQLAMERQRCDEEMAALRSRAAHGDAASADLAEAKARATRLETEKNELRSEREMLRGSVTELQGRIAEFRTVDEEVRKMTEEVEAARRRAVVMEQERDQIRSKLAPFMDFDRVGVDITPLGVRITVQETILFESGKAELNPGASDLLSKIASALKASKAAEIRVVGHTDNVPIKTKDFPSNWELSTARALAVLHKLSDAYGVKGSRLAAIGYGEHRPVAGNGTVEGRAKNRRVEIFLVPQGM